MRAAALLLGALAVAILVAASIFDVGGPESGTPAPRRATTDASPPPPTLLGPDPAAPAPAPESAPPDAASKTGRLRVVVRGPSGEAVPGARVRLIGFDLRTDASGSAVADPMEAGYAHPFVTAPGHASTWGEVKVEPDTETTAEVTLVRGVVLEGRVLDRETGRPMADALVRTGEAEQPQGDDPHDSCGEATSDAEGRFRIDTLPKGRAGTIWAEARGWSRGSTTWETDDFGNPVRGADLALEPAGWAEATVRRSDGAPAVGTLLVVVPEGQSAAGESSVVDWCRGCLDFSEQSRLVHTDERGEAVLTGLSFGTRYSLLVFDPREAAPATLPTLLATAARPQLRIDARLRAPARLRLTATGSERLHVQVDGSEPWDKPRSPGFAYVGGGIVPGHRTVRISARGSRPSTFQVDFAEGATVDREAGLEPTDPDATISGTVVDATGRAMSRARVEVSANERKKDLATTFTTDLGEFVAEGLPVGELCRVRIEGRDGAGVPFARLVAHGVGVPTKGLRYVLKPKGRVVARFRVPSGGPAPKAVEAYDWVGGAPGYYPDSVPWGMPVEWVLDDAAARIGLSAPGYALWEKDVVAKPGDRLDLGEIELDPGATLSGRVLDPEGHPIAGARVELDHVHGPEAISDPAGAFALPNLPRGRVRLEASAVGFLDEVVVADTGRSDLVVPMRRGGVVRLTLRSAAGGPAPGYRVEVGSIDETLPEPRSVTGGTDDAGLYSARLSPGRYAVEIFRGWDDAPPLVRGEVVLTEGVDTPLALEVP